MPEDELVPQISPDGKPSAEALQANAQMLALSGAMHVSDPNRRIVSMKGIDLRAIQRNLCVPSNYHYGT